jgi:hypothetical protein
MATGPANANMQNSNMAMTMVVVQQIVAASSIAAGRMARATGRMARATATTATAKKKHSGWRQSQKIAAKLVTAEIGLVSIHG